MLVLEGSVDVRAETGTATLTRGEALFVEHADGAISLSGNGTAAVACVPAG